jgi:hypothetical protein
MPNWTRIFYNWILPPVQIAVFQTATGIVYHITTPWLVYYHVLHIFTPYWGASTFSERLLESANTICFAPHFLPTRVWKCFNPPPCSHNGCRLRRYVSPAPPPLPTSWYTYLESLYRPIQCLYRRIRPRRCPEQDSDALMFLRLPVEIPHLIYVYVSGARHEIQCQDPWRVRYDKEDMMCYHDTRNREDITSYQIGDDGIIACHGQRPPTNLLLVRQQVHNEARKQCPSTTVFEL